MKENNLTIGEVKCGNIKITISNFNGGKFLDIRKYYEDDLSGETKPGKKGITLNKVQFQSVLEILNNKKGDIEVQL